MSTERITDVHLRRMLDEVRPRNTPRARNRPPADDRPDEVRRASWSPKCGQYLSVAEVAHELGVRAGARASDKVVGVFVVQVAAGQVPGSEASGGGQVPGSEASGEVIVLSVCRPASGRCAPGSRYARYLPVSGRFVVLRTYVGKPPKFVQAEPPGPLGDRVSIDRARLSLPGGSA